MQRRCSFARWKDRRNSRRRDRAYPRRVDNVSGISVYAVLFLKSRCIYSDTMPLQRYSDPRKALATCLDKGIGESSTSGRPRKLISPARRVKHTSPGSDLWSEATVPYNLRLKTDTSPLAIVYGT